MTTVKCECGDEVPEGETSVDVAGCVLCPACAIDSSVPCTPCGNQFVPVKLYHPNGEPVDLVALGIFGPPMDYYGVCESCDKGAE